MSATFEDYQREYKANLSRIRGYLASSASSAGGRNLSTLHECDRLLQQAKQSATAMMAMAEVEGNAMKVLEAKQLMERDIGPLGKEIQRTLAQAQQVSGRLELLPGQSSSSYRAPSLDGFSNDYRDHAGSSSDMDSLIQSSADMLRESQSILLETEAIGDETLWQMNRQREQLQSAHTSLMTVQAAAVSAGRVLRTMSRKACTNRWSLYVMIAALVLLNLWVLKLIYQKNHASHSEPDFWSSAPAPGPTW